MEVYYTKEHEWVRVEEDNTALVGVTGYAVDQLGDITFIELPQIGTEAAQGEFLCEIESVKAASDIYMPVSGAVKEVNSSLENNPEKINADPEGEGWIAKVSMESKEELQNLMKEQEYREYVSSLQ